jgi:uncharacterized membrane protein
METGSGTDAPSGTEQAGPLVAARQCLTPSSRAGAMMAHQCRCWGLSPALNKLVGMAGVPVTYIVVAAGFGVGIGLALLHLVLRERFGMIRAVVL